MSALESRKRPAQTPPVSITSHEAEPSSSPMPSKNKKERPKGSSSDQQLETRNGPDETAGSKKTRRKQLNIKGSDSVTDHLDKIENQNKDYPKEIEEGNSELITIQEEAVMKEEDRRDHVQLQLSSMSTRSGQQQKDFTAAKVKRCLESLLPIPFYEQQEASDYRQNVFPASDKQLPVKSSVTCPNLEFYLNKAPFKPRGLKIDELLSKWKGNYEILEENHNYIQWLFPLRTAGLNRNSYPLTDSEIHKMQSNKEVQKRLISSYELMLDFLGIRLLDSQTGKLERIPDTSGKNSGYISRFRHFERRTHNHLRVTRMLRSLGELGLPHLQAPLVEFLIDQVLDGRLSESVLRSCMHYWLPSVLDDGERERLFQLVQSNSQ